MFSKALVIFALVAHVHAQGAGITMGKMKADGKPTGTYDKNKKDTHMLRGSWKISNLCLRPNLALKNLI